MANVRTISPQTARRLAISRQRLAGSRPAPDKDGIMELFRDLGCVQIDPIRAVERTQLLVLWSRLGSYDSAVLDDLMYEERRLFEYWAHAASIVRTEDYPLFRLQMTDWDESIRTWTRRAREWMAENDALRRHILARLEEDGPLPSKELSAEQLQDESADWESTGWTNGQNVRVMLNYLLLQGTVMVSGRRGVTKLWDLSERCLPNWTPSQELDWPAVVYRTAQVSLRALGVARPEHIKEHFTRRSYPDLDNILSQLEEDGLIVRVAIEDGDMWPGSWYLHSDDLPLLHRLEEGDWFPRTVLLSPFDNLICDRSRTEELFDFHFRIEIYVPKAKRQYGYYVLPILRGDRLIGRIDPKMNRKAGRLDVNAVYAEPDAPMTAEVGQVVAAAIEDLATFVGARSIRYGRQLPDGWRRAFQ